mmetsp:Transcript_108411/g.306522  ORF Transcript_108411/g.306522 Transcript_108411/m.306522 type:complete len:574 (-) Transcript_108411:14-1735(-)
MPALDISIGTDNYKSIDVPEGCTVGRWKEFIGQGLLGSKILYAEKLVCRAKLGGPILEDTALLPISPERMHIEGRVPVLKVLQLALKDKLKQPNKSPHLMHPRPAGDELRWNRNTLAAGKDGVETAAAKVFAQELDEATIRRIWKRFPHYTGEVPPTAVFWSEGDLERFFASGGQLRPCEVAEPGGQTCLLLRKLRLDLAERGVSKVTADYKSLSRHLESAGFKGLRPGEQPPAGCTAVACAGATEVQRVDRVPKALREPVVLPWVPGSQGQVPSWDLDYWKREHGDWLWTCRATSPPSEGDNPDGPDSVGITASVAEFVDYARVLMDEDPSCEEEAAMAYFRVSLDGWPAFTQATWPIFEKHWKEFTPPGAEDLTVRWVRMFGDKFNRDWLENFARFFRVSLAAPGTVSRLQRENNGAHLWHAQTQGRRLFVLFPPKDSERLYGLPGGRLESKEGYTASASPVDLFAPSKRHPRFAEASARVALLEAGETLVVPSGWWRYSAALEPGASVQQAFFNGANHGLLIAELEDKMWQYGELDPGSREAVQAALAELRDEIAEDNEDWGLTVTEGGS